VTDIILADDPQKTLPPASVVEVKNLVKQFGDQVAVDHISFSVPPGSIFGFIGPSGCGKTTTVRLLTGIYKPTTGEAVVLARPPDQFTRAERENIGYMPQNFVLYPDLSVWENLNFAASIYGVGLKRRKRLNRLLDFVELLEHKRKLVRNISGGMMRRLTLAATLVHEPDLLFLDEPTTGIDPVLRRKFWDYFETLRDSGTTLFITTQYVSEAAYCDMVGVMNKGRLLMVDTPDGLMRRALGGEVIDLRTAGPIDYQVLQEMEQLPFVLGPIKRVESDEVRILVDVAETALPLLIGWCGSRNVPIESVQAYLPPFDDVFVTLIERFNNRETDL
jgi:ABC-2 type transport system ATP-binding protein